MLVFNNGTDFPLVSAMRINKYLSKGYTISKNEHVKVLLSCVNLTITSYKELESHIGGMYGVKLSELIDTTSEFDLQKAIIQLSECDKSIDESRDFVWLDEDEEYEKEIKKFLDKFIPTNVKKISKHKLIIFPTGKVSKNYDYIDFNELEEYNGDVLLYKYVKKTKDPNVFSSFFKEEFKYKVGEEIADESHGIHCGIIESKKSFTYSMKENKVLLELRVKLDDIKNFSDYSNTTVKKAFVVRAIKEDYINNNNLEIEF